MTTPFRSAKTRIVTVQFLKIFSKINFYNIKCTGQQILNWLQSSKIGNNVEIYNDVLLSGELAHAYGLEIQKSQKLPFSWKYYLTGFLNRIGDPRMQGELFGQATIGVAMLQMWVFSLDFKKDFELTESDLEDIAAAINNYCPIDEEDAEKNIERIQKLRLCMTHEARQLLCSLTMINSNSLNEDKIRKFTEHLMSDNLDTKYISQKKKGVLILIQGYTEEGKQNIAYKLIQHLSHTSSSRDNVIYINSQDMLLNIIRRPNWEKGHLNPEEIWNREIEDKINDALVAQRICIVNMDIKLTLSLYSGISPIAARNCAWKISLWAHSFPLSPDDSFQNYTDPIGKPIPKRLMATVYDDKTNKVTPLQPHFSIPIYWNNKELEIDNLMWNTLERLVHSLVYPPGIDNNTQPLPLIKDTIDLSSQELIWMLVNKCGLEGLRSFFTIHKFSIELEKYDPLMNDHDDDNAIMIDSDPDVLILVYIYYLGYDNDLWRPLWARQASGRVYTINERTGDVIEVVRSLERCALLLQQDNVAYINNNEVAPHFPTDYSQNDMFLKKVNSAIGSNNNQSLDNIYVCQDLAASLIIVSVYRKDSKEYNIMNTVINRTRNSSINLWYFNTTNFLIQVSTPHGINMIRELTIKTSLLKYLNAISDTQNKHLDIDDHYEDEEEEEYEKSLDIIWMCLKATLGNLVESILTDEEYKEENMFSLMMKIDMENRVYLLGMYYGDLYHPHFHLSNKPMFTSFNIKFPLYRQVLNTQQVDYIYKEYYECISTPGKWYEFCKKWFSYHDCHIPLSNNSVGFTLWGDNWKIKEENSLSNL